MYIRRNIHEQLTDEKRQFFNFKLTKNVSDFISLILQITTVILTPFKSDYRKLRILCKFCIFVQNSNVDC